MRLQLILRGMLMFIPNVVVVHPRLIETFHKEMKGSQGTTKVIRICLLWTINDLQVQQQQQLRESKEGLCLSSKEQVSLKNPLPLSAASSSSVSCVSRESHLSAVVCPRQSIFSSVFPTKLSAAKQQATSQG